MKENNYPKVSIIILNWNGLKDTIECLDSLKKIIYPNYEVIVVDNGSKGNDANVLEEKYKDYIGIIRNKENLGFAGGNNVGIRRAIKRGADFVLLLNNDTIVEPDFLDELVKIAEKDEKTAIIGSIIFDYYTEKIVFTNAKIDRKLKMERKIDYLNSDKDWWESEGVSGASMMLKVEHLLKHSLFLDESLFLYCEESDLCGRTRRNGLKIVMAGRAKVYHKEGKSSGGAISPITVYYILRNRILLANKHLKLNNKIIFWTFFVSARLFRVLEWTIKKRWKLIRITYWAFIDGIKEHAGKTQRKLTEPSL